MSAIIFRALAGLIKGNKPSITITRQIAERTSLNTAAYSAMVNDAWFSS